MPLHHRARRDIAPPIRSTRRTRGRRQPHVGAGRHAAGACCRGPRDKYDHVVLAGAALGTVIVMDHRDCGASKVILDAAHAKDAQTETASHTIQFKTLKGMIASKYPKLKIETLLMALDGKVDIVS